jgi:hypothetical protein
MPIPKTGWNTSRAYVGETVVTRSAYTTPPLSRLMSCLHGRGGVIKGFNNLIHCKTIHNTAHVQIDIVPA